MDQGQTKRRHHIAFVGLLRKKSLLQKTLNVAEDLKLGAAVPKHKTKLQNPGDTDFKLGEPFEIKYFI